MINNLSDPIRTARTIWHACYVADQNMAGEGFRVFLSHRVGHSPLWVKLGDARGLVFTIGAGIATGVGFDDKWVGAGTALLAAGLDRVRVLTQEEQDVFDAIDTLAFRKVCRVWVKEKEIFDALPAALDTDAHRRTLACMKTKGILEEGAGLWRAVW